MRLSRQNKVFPHELASQYEAASQDAAVVCSTFLYVFYKRIKLESHLFKGIPKLLYSPCWLRNHKKPNFGPLRTMIWILMWNCHVSKLFRHLFLLLADKLKLAKRNVGHQVLLQIDRFVSQQIVWTTNSYRLANCSGRQIVLGEDTLLGPKLWSPCQVEAHSE